MDQVPVMYMYSYCYNLQSFEHVSLYSFHITCVISYGILNETNNYTGKYTSQEVNFIFHFLHFSFFHDHSIFFMSKCILCENRSNEEFLFFSPNYYCFSLRNCPFTIHLSLKPFKRSSGEYIFTSLQVFLCAVII